MKEITTTENKKTPVDYRAEVDQTVQLLKELARNNSNSLPTPVNYTAEQTSQLLKEWEEKAGDSLPATEKKAFTEILGEKFGKSGKSIIQKLVREKAYTSKGYVGKSGVPFVAKSDIVTEIGDFLDGLGYSDSDLESLTKATKPLLQALARSFKDLKKELEER